MNRGVELLLKRMDSHPEEFADMKRDTYGDHNPTKWDQILYDVFHRVEEMDRDNGLDRSDGVALGRSRMGKRLGYLSDEEVLLIFNKLNDVRARLFETRIMNVILSDEPKGYDEVETYPSPPTYTTAIGYT